MSKSAIDQFTRCIALGKNDLFFSHSLFILFSVICIVIVGENTGDTHTTHISPRASVEASASELCLVCQVYVLLLNYYLLCSYYDHIDLSLSLCRLSPSSPGVIITDVHRRAGLDEEQYAQVTYYVIQGPNTLFYKVVFTGWGSKMYVLYIVKCQCFRELMAYYMTENVVSHLVIMQYFSVSPNSLTCSLLPHLSFSPFSSLLPPSVP